MPINNSPTRCHQSSRDIDAHKDIEDGQNKLKYDLSLNSDLSPEDAARVIWKQWMIIRRLVVINNIQIEIPTTTQKEF